MRASCCSLPSSSRPGPCSLPRPVPRPVSSPAAVAAPVGGGVLRPERRAHRGRHPRRGHGRGESRATGRTSIPFPAPSRTPSRSPSRPSSRWTSTPSSSRREQCGALDVWNAVGVNRPVAGIVEDPLRIEPRAYAVRQSPPSYVCGAVAVELDGRRPPSRRPPHLRDRAAEPTRARVPALLLVRRRRPRRPGARRDGARARRRPRWQVRSWVMWTAFYDDFPGRAVLRERAAALCGPGDGRVAADRRLVGGRDAAHLVLPQVSVMS